MKNLSNILENLNLNDYRYSIIDMLINDRKGIGIQIC